MYLRVVIDSSRPWCKGKRLYLSNLISGRESSLDRWATPNLRNLWTDMLPLTWGCWYRAQGHSVDQSGKHWLTSWWERELNKLQKVKIFLIWVSDWETSLENSCSPFKKKQAKKSRASQPSRKQKQISSETLQFILVVLWGTRRIPE